MKHDEGEKNNIAFTDDIDNLRGIKLRNILPTYLQSYTTAIFFLVIFCLGFANAYAAEIKDKFLAPEYLIEPEDTLNISVWKEEGLQKDVLVRPDGGISFPLVGDLIAAGKSTSQIQTEITTKLKKYIPQPVVTVSLLKLAGYKVYVLGKVNKPGQFIVGSYVDVMQVLTLAGGLTPYASENDVKIIRRINGKEIVFPFEYSEVKSGERLQQNIILKSGDVVVVP